MSECDVIRASSPGRVCLFGEHLDYLGLPVIAAAISMRMHVEGYAAEGSGWVIRKQDLGTEDRFEINSCDLEYVHGHAADFLRSAFNVLRRSGVTLPQGAEFRVWGEVPIQAGTSSSSALQIAWTAALLALGRDPRVGDAEEIARLAYVSEVHEFEASGGMMDQFSSAMGGVIRIDQGKRITVQRIGADLGTFVLGHSHEPKDTQAVLSRVQAAARSGAAVLAEHLGDFDWHRTSLADALRVAEGLSASEDLQVALGALRNRDLLSEGHRVLTAETLDHVRLGQLLSEHHRNLRDSLRISTPKIDRMLGAALEAGALGGKINGSGGGGCMFVYAPDNPERVAEAIRRAGGEAWVVSVDRGVEVTS